jgi:hypothetical protein
MQTTIAVMVLVVPTMLMSATFPLISRALVADERPLYVIPVGRPAQ